MKKISLFLLLSVFVLALNIFAENGYDGGPARLLSMGGPEITVADESNQLDLYGEGFTPGIFMRPQTSFVAIYPEFDVYTYNTNGDVYSKRSEFLIGGGTGTTFPSNDGIQYFLSPDSVLIIKPLISGFGGNQTYMSDKENYGQILTGGEVNYAQKLNTNFAASATLGYLWQGYYDTFQDNSKNNSWIDKLEYEISGAFLPDTADGWSYALSLGNKTALFVTGYENYDLIMDPGDYTRGEAPFQFFNTHLYYTSENYYNSTPTAVEGYIDDYVGGTRISLGAASAKTNRTQFDIKAGVLVDMSITDKFTEVDTDKTTGVFTTTKSPDYMVLKNGTGFDGEAAFRADLGGINAGVKVTETYLSGDMTGGKRWINIAGISAGEAFGDKNFLVPVELFYQEERADTRDDTGELSGLTYDMGIKIGNEIAIGENMAVRYGVDFTALSNYSKQTGASPYESSPTGSQENPWMMQLGYNAGMGFTGKSYELNIGVRVEPQWETPKENQYSSYNVINTKIFSDLKIFI
jgi:hypothetical protein